MSTVTRRSGVATRAWGSTITEHRRPPRPGRPRRRRTGRALERGESGPSGGGLGSGQVRAQLGRQANRTRRKPLIGSPAIKPVLPRRPAHLALEDDAEVLRVL